MTDRKENMNVVSMALELSGFGSISRADWTGHGKLAGRFRLAGIEYRTDRQPVPPGLPAAIPVGQVWIRWDSWMLQWARMADICVSRPRRSYAWSPVTGLWRHCLTPGPAL